MDNQIQKHLTPTFLLKWMVPGAIIGLVIISVFVFTADNPDPAWGKFWRIRPLIITPLAAAFGFLAFSLKDIIRPEGNLYKAVVYMASLVIFVIALWLGIVLGLDGTLWN